MESLYQKQPNASDMEQKQPRQVSQRICSGYRLNKTEASKEEALTAKYTDLVKFNRPDYVRTVSVLVRSSEPPDLTQKYLTCHLRVVTMELHSRPLPTHLFIQCAD